MNIVNVVSKLCSIIEVYGTNVDVVFNEEQTDFTFTVLDNSDGHIDRSLTDIIVQVQVEVQD